MSVLGMIWVFNCMGCCRKELGCILPKFCKDPMGIHQYY